MDRKQLLHDIRARPVNFVPGKRVVSIAPGEWTSPYEGKGYEPLGYRDFEIGDDPRRINIPATARRGVTNLFFDDPSKALKGTRKLPLSRCLPPNAMLIYCSDFLQADGNLTDLAFLRRRVQRYDFIPVIIQDNFEYSFPIVPYGTFLNFANPETGNSDEAWITPKSSGNIQKLHEFRYQNLVTELGPIGTRSIHLSTPDILKTGEIIGKFFRRRVGRKG
jgi:hypothetical protein